MPTVAAYLVMVTLIAPSMVEFRFASITSYFYVYYFAMITSNATIALARGRVMNRGHRLNRDGADLDEDRILIV